MKKVIVTGATGFVGGALAKKLLEDGATVYGVGRSAEKLEELKKYDGFKAVIADFDDYYKLPAIIAERGFSSIYHLAWQGTTATTKTFNDYNVQIDNIRALCDTVSVAAEMGCEKFINVCSNYSLPMTDNCSPCNGVSIYGLAKRTGDEFSKLISYKNKLGYLTAIIPNVFGEGDKPETALNFFIRKMLKDEPLKLIKGERPEDWIYITDAVNGLISVATLNDYYKDFYVGHKKITTFKEKLLYIKDILNSKSELLFGQYPENSYIDYNKFDLQKLFELTGFECKVNFKESILKTARWLENSEH